MGPFSLTWLMSTPSRPNRRLRRAARHGKLSVELLETRLAPAIFNPLPTTPDGLPGSLRATIITANSNGADDTFNLAAGTYNLTIANGPGGRENAAARGDLDLTEAGRSYTFVGAGPGVTIINANSLDRVFHILGNATAIFRNLTITGGLAQDNGTAGAQPGTRGKRRRRHSQYRRHRDAR